ncbi:hypothetical protein HYY73_06395 [Candidatus Woesearchaeota archaeon]|nr:hypothetical protein [Candidatus Woesearchaeota archaeon]
MVSLKEAQNADVTALKTSVRLEKIEYQDWKQMIMDWEEVRREFRSIDWGIWNVRNLLSECINEIAQGKQDTGGRVRINGNWMPIRDIRNNLNSKLKEISNSCLDVWRRLMHFERYEDDLSKRSGEVLEEMKKITGRRADEPLSKLLVPDERYTISVGQNVGKVIRALLGSVQAIQASATRIAGTLQTGKVHPKKTLVRLGYAEDLKLQLRLGVPVDLQFAEEEVNSLYTYSVQTFNRIESLHVVIETLRVRIVDALNRTAAYSKTA